jgi:hypothetical protein
MSCLLFLRFVYFVYFGLAQTGGLQFRPVRRIAALYRRGWRWRSDQSGEEPTTVHRGESSG